MFHFALVFGKIEVCKPDGEDIHFVEIPSGGGVVLPVLSAANANPTNGEIYVDSTTNYLFINKNNAWVQVI